MGILQWLLLGTIFTLYLLLGGSVFMVMEQGNEIHRLEELALLRQDIQGILFRMDQDFYNNSTSTEVLEGIKQAKQGVISRISESCAGTNFLDVNSTQGVLRWTFYNSVFYAFTAVTTIGYGNLAPETQWSRIFTIFYALFGIPLNGIVLAKLSGVYRRKLVKAGTKSSESRVAFAFNIIFYLTSGFVVFMVIPAGFFVVIESWGYLDAIYFSFVTLTTIGFGDYVAGMGDGHAAWLWTYKIVIIIWIVFGLGYLVMILGFITKGITSKKMRTVLEKKINRIRMTKEKLAKDVEHMRKVVNELYLTQGDGGYLSANGDSQNSLDYYLASCQHNQVPRSKSFLVPRLSIGGPVDQFLIRSFSESDLDRFNRQQTMTSAGVNRRGSTVLLAQLVASLEGTITDVLDAVADVDNLKNEPNNNDDRRNSNLIPENHEARCDASNQIDEQNLLTKANGNLEQVVIHKLENGPISGILTKVGGALRKISSGNSLSSQPSSRKVSRNETETNPAPQNYSTHPPCYYPKHTDELTEECTDCGFEPCAKCRRSGNSMPRNFSQISCGSATPSESERPKRKISKTGATYDQSTRSFRKSTAIDPQSLAEILKVLDDVQEQLARHEVLFSASATEADDGGGVANFGFVSSNDSSPTLGRRHLDSRNRKVGIFNPDFKYFHADLTGSSEKRRDLDRSVES